MARRKKKGKIAVIIILSVLILAAAGICIFVFNTPAYVDSAKEKTGITISGLAGSVSTCSPVSGSACRGVAVKA